MNNIVNTTFNYKGQIIDVIITYKKVKQLNCRVRDGKLYISAPRRSSVNFILNSIPNLPTSFLDLLLKEQDIGDNYIYILGEKRHLQHILDGDIKPNPIFYINKEDLEKKLKSLAVEIITKRVRYYEQLMGISRPYKVHVKNMASRYGSNSRKTHSLAFALKLIHYPISVIDSVVVHELAHDRYFDHSRNFYNEVLKYYPNYYIEQKKLKGGHES